MATASSSCCSCRGGGAGDHDRQQRAARSMGSARPAPLAAPPATTDADGRFGAWMTGRLCPPRGRRGGLGVGRVLVGRDARRGRPASRSENAQHTSAQCRRIARSDADLEVGPAELAFDLLVALLDPVAQPVQAHDLGQLGLLGAARCRSGQVGQQIPGAVPGQAGRGRCWPPPAAAAGPGPSRQAGRRPPTRSRCGRHGSGGSPAATVRACWIPASRGRRPPRPGCGPASAGAQVPLRGLRASTNGTLAAPRASVKPGLSP